MNIEVIHYEGLPIPPHLPGDLGIAGFYRCNNNHIHFSYTNGEDKVLVCTGDTSKWESWTLPFLILRANGIPWPF